MSPRAKNKRTKQAGLLCPECDREMNHHADKLVDPTSAEEAARANPTLGGIVEGIYSCPDCGRAESREES